MLVSRRSGAVRAVRSAGGAAKQVMGRVEQRRAAQRASWARGARGYERAAGRARARGKLRDVHAHSQETGEKEGERRKEKKRRKEKGKGKGGGERKKREGRKRKEERGGIRGGRSRVGDRQPSGAGWDGGEEKEEGFGRCFEVG